MAYVVTDNCIRCKYTDCVVVCPVDCFHEGANMLVIDPDECIDCGICQLECPANAIVPGGESTLEWLELNKYYSQKWPVITTLLEPPHEADKFNGIKDKKEKFFDENAGDGKNVR